MIILMSNFRVTSSVSLLAVGIIYRVCAFHHCIAYPLTNKVFNPSFIGEAVTPQKGDIAFLSILVVTVI
jgi:hypothetical protein